MPYTSTASRVLIASLLLASIAACSGSSEPPTSVGAPSDPSAAGLASLSLGRRVLYPSFSPDHHDYSTRCDAEPSMLGIAAEPEERGATIRTDPAHLNWVVRAFPDDLVTITVESSEGDVSYHLRCLPPDFPILEAEVTGDGPKPGWYLTAFGFNDPAARHWIVVLDENGAVIWYKRSQRLVMDVKVLQDGHLTWSTSNGPGANVISERTLDGEVLRTWRAVGTYTDSHDMLRLASGNVVVGGITFRNGVDLRALAPHFGPVGDVTDSWLQEVTPEGDVVWEWHSEDHIGVAETIVDDVNAVDLVRDGRVDLTHWNSIGVDDDGSYVISLRNTDAAYKIRRAPGEPDDGMVVWKLGGNTPTDPRTVHLRVLGDALGGPVRPHDARPSAEGHVTMFDNRTYRKGEPARGLEYRIDEAAGTATLVTEHHWDTGKYSCCFGSMRRTDHDTYVIAWSRTNPVFTEFDTDGSKLLEVAQRDGHGIYRVTWVPADALNRDELRASAGGVAELAPLPRSPRSPAVKQR
jgi:hypothetical protein